MSDLWDRVPFADHACPKCAVSDDRAGKPRPKDRPCDICNGTAWSYIGDPCRHCNPASRSYVR